jgi:hypothetical protein
MLTATRRSPTNCKLPLAGCAERFVGSSIDEAIGILHWLQAMGNGRLDVPLQMKLRKVEWRRHTPDGDRAQRRVAQTVADPRQDQRWKELDRRGLGCKQPQRQSAVATTFATR